MSQYSFFALAFRMKYINRWGLMRNLRNENLTEHCAQCAMLTHALCVIGNKHFGKNYDADRVALYGLYHDMSEIFTGDLPTPVKYFNSSIRDSYKQIEKDALEKALSKLPESLREEYSEILSFEEIDSDAKLIVKGADKLCAYLKCVEECENGNREFAKALEGTKKAVDDLCKALPELQYFMDNFTKAFECAIDEL